MKTIKLYSIGLVAVMTFTFSQQTFSQPTSPLYNIWGPAHQNFIRGMQNNQMWNMAKKEGTSGVAKSTESSRSSASEVPVDQSYPSVKFKPTGTRLILQDYIDYVGGSPQDKAKTKEMVLEIFNKYEAAAAAKGFQNDWALALVSYIGLNSHVYQGKTEKPIIPFEQNVGLRDVVAEHATDKGIFNNVPDRKKQEQYEFLVLFGGLTYHLCEKARMEKNTEELENCKLAAAKNFEVIGIKP